MIDALRQADWPAPLRHVEMIDDNVARVILGPINTQGEQRGLAIHVNGIENISKAVSEVTEKIAKAKDHGTP
jgi:hypothetical protein